ncbi:MAG: hypothetical protein IJK04_15920, partial [Kiritimatiellae bacterium]|nr:hypothetical protein [Kiritimatiellia bacterium]
VFGPGAHEVGIVTLKSGDTVYIDPGAIVYGGFHAKDAEDIAIVGCGIIDGGHLKEKILFETSGDGSEDVHNATREHTVDFRNCRRIRIDGPTFRDSLLYNIAMWGCEDIDVRHVKIVGQWRFNTDGIDLHNCRRAYVSDCFARTFDDTFCFKAHEGYGNCEDGVFERCVAWNDWGKAFEVGVECRAEHLRRLVFRDCDCIHAVGTVLDVANVDYGHVSDILFEDIRVECDDPMPSPQFQKTDDSPFDAIAGLDRPPRLFQADVWYSPEYSNENGGQWSGGGFIDGVTVRDVSAYSAGRLSQIGMRIAALDEGHRPEKIVVEGVSLDGRMVDEKEGVVLSLAGPATPPAFAALVPRVARTLFPAGTEFCFNPDEKTFRPLSNDYAVSLNGRPVEVRACRESRIPFNRVWPGRQRPLDQTERAAYIACEADGPIACLVTPAHPFRRTVVRPLSKGVSTSVADGGISFTLPGPGYYVLETDGPHKALHIFVEKPREFPEKEQATLRYGPGMHIAGLVHLKDHDRVYIDRDAIVFGCFTGENVRDV